MGIHIRVVDVDIDADNISGRAEKDAKLWTFAAKEWHRLYTPYVPMDTGILTNTVRITPKQIEHTVPYARAQYHGRFNHKRIYHPRASRMWDKAAQSTQMPKLNKAIQAYIDSGRVKFDD